MILWNLNLDETSKANCHFIRQSPDLTDEEKEFQSLLENEDCDRIKELYSDKKLTENEVNIFTKYVLDAMNGNVKVKNQDWINECGIFP